MLKRITSPYVVGVGARVLGQLISFLAVAVASRFLDLTAFGVFALAWAVTVVAAKAAPARRREIIFIVVFPDWLDGSGSVFKRSRAHQGCG